MSKTQDLNVKPWERSYAERFSGRKPKVCIGFVSFGDVYAEVFESMLVWAFQAGKRYSDQFEISVAVATRKEQYRARNFIIEEAQKEGCDFLLMLDDDHTLSDCPDILGHFYREEKPFQGGLYVQRRNDKIQPVIVKYDESNGLCHWAEMDEVPVDGGPVDVLGGGINWFDMTIFDFLGQPHWWPYPSDRREVIFLPDEQYGLDLQISIKAKKIGVQPWLNGNVKLGHVAHERRIIYPPGKEHATRCGKCGGVAASRDGKWECMVCQTVIERAA